MDSDFPSVSIRQDGKTSSVVLWIHSGDTQSICMTPNHAMYLSELLALAARKILNAKEPSDQAR